MEDKYLADDEQPQAVYPDLPCPEEHVECDCSADDGLCPYHGEQVALYIYRQTGVYLPYER